MDAKKKIKELYKFFYFSCLLNNNFLPFNRISCRPNKNVNLPTKFHVNLTTIRFLSPYFYTSFTPFEIPTTEAQSKGRAIIFSQDKVWYIGGRQNKIFTPMMLDKPFWPLSPCCCDLPIQLFPINLPQESIQQ